MDSFELNKLAGAFLGSLLIIFGIGIIGDMIFATHEPETPGYLIAVAETPGDGEAPAEAVEESIAIMLADADVAAGEASARKCAACHTFEQGGPHRAGPNLYDIVERPIAAVEGFSYSDALRAHAQEAGTWSFDELNAFVAAPQQAVPRTTMGFAGIRNPEERADLLAYLRTLSSDPAPLPEPPAETPQPAAGTAQPSPSQPEGPPSDEEGAEAQPQAEAQEGQPEQQGQVQQQGEAQQQQGTQGQQPVMVVPPAEQAGEQPGGGTQQQAQAPAQQPEAPAQQAQAPADLPPALALMAEVEVEDGRAEARKCQACHALEEGGGNRVGPPLWGIVDSPVAEAEGYSFSPALAEFGQGRQWDFATLDAFIQAPQQLVPGTKMAFPGIRNERDRAELLVYLNSLSSEPAPLPGAQQQQ